MTDVTRFGDGVHRLCCVCSTAIDPNPTNMCLNCIRTTVNITGKKEWIAVVSLLNR